MEIIAGRETMDIVDDIFKKYRRLAVQLAPLDRARKRDNRDEYPYEVGSDEQLAAALVWAEKYCPRNLAWAVQRVIESDYKRTKEDKEFSLRYPNAGKKWSDTELSALRRLAPHLLKYSRFSVKDEVVERLFGRPANTIKAKITRMINKNEIQ